MKGVGTALESLFALTKPRGARLAYVYKEALTTVLELPVDQGQLRSFKRQKKSGGERTITPAARELRIVQYVLSMWLKDNFPKSADYCYTGKGVLSAVIIHRESRYAIVCDLKDAFDHVTWNMIYRKIKLCQPSIEEKVVEEITKSNPFNMGFCEAQIGRFVKGSGFETSWIKRFVKEPIEYLGTKISGSEISLADESLWKFCNILDEAINSSYPKDYEKTVRGIENWAKRVCEGKIPPILQRIIGKYRQRLKEMEPLF